MLVGASSQFVATPCDVVKVQMQIDGQRVKQGLPLRYTSMFGAYAQLWRTGGVRALWRGWVPSCQRAGLVQLGDLTAYDAAKQRVRVWTGGDNTYCHVISSAFAGLVAAFMSCPADVVKTRIMNQDVEKPMYKGSIDCFRKTVQQEGLLALWKGFIPAYLRCAPWSMTFYVSYEQLRKTTRQGSYCA